MRASLNLVLTTFGKPFFKDFLLPGGRLRESQRGVRRADVVVVTKCSSGISEDILNRYKKEIQKYTRPNVPVFFSRFDYGVPVPIGVRAEADSKNVLFFSGIADDRPALDYLKRKYKSVVSLKFSDHHRYTASDLQKVVRKYREMNGTDSCIMTTEKDMVKLHLPELRDVLKDLPVFYIPVKARFLKDESKFAALIDEVVHGR